jgi:hypothetical protein
LELATALGCGCSSIFSADSRPPRKCRFIDGVIPPEILPMSQRRSHIQFESERGHLGSQTEAHQPSEKGGYRAPRLQGGEILMGVVGSIGKLGIAPESWRGANIARAICRIMPSERLSRRYILWLLQSHFAGMHRLPAKFTRSHSCNPSNPPRSNIRAARSRSYAHIRPAARPTRPRA